MYFDNELCVVCGHEKGLYTECANCDERHKAAAIAVVKLGEMLAKFDRLEFEWEHEIVSVRSTYLGRARTILASGVVVPAGGGS